MIAQLKPSVYLGTAGCIFRCVESEPIGFGMQSLSSALSAKPVDFDVECRWGEGVPRGAIAQGLGQIADVRLYHQATIITNHKLPASVAVLSLANNVSVEAFDAVDKTFLLPKVYGSISGWRLGRFDDAA